MMISPQPESDWEPSPWEMAATGAISPQPDSLRAGRVSSTQRLPTDSDHRDCPLTRIIRVDSDHRATVH